MPVYETVKREAGALENRGHRLTSRGAGQYRVQVQNGIRQLASFGSGGLALTASNHTTPGMGTTRASPADSRATLCAAAVR